MSTLFEDLQEGLQQAIDFANGTLNISRYSYTATKMDEEDGSVTLALNEIDLVENGKDEQEARSKLAAAIFEYAEDFYSDFSYWGSAPNRKSHIPYVFKTLVTNDIQKIGNSIIITSY